jgi:hypothetical protein
MNVGSEYLFGKGKIALAERDNSGTISEILYVGNCPELKISGSTEKVDHYESMSGLNVKDRAMVKSAAFEMSMTLESITEDNLAVITWGSKVDIASAASQSHFFPAGIANGEYHIVPDGFNLSACVVKDSAGYTGDCRARFGLRNRHSVRRHQVR